MTFEEETLSWLKEIRALTWWKSNKVYCTAKKLQYLQSWIALHANFWHGFLARWQEDSGRAYPGFENSWANPCCAEMLLEAPVTKILRPTWDSEGAGSLPVEASSETSDPWERTNCTVMLLYCGSWQVTGRCSYTLNHAWQTWLHLDLVYEPIRNWVSSHSTWVTLLCGVSRNIAKSNVMP